MKTNSIVLYLMTALGLATPASPCLAQPAREAKFKEAADPSLDAAQEKYRQATERETELLKKTLAVEGWSESPDERNKLRSLIEETFAARQELQRAELRELQRRLDAIGRAMHDRESHKELIIDARLNELLSGQQAAEAWVEREEQIVVNGVTTTRRVKVPVRRIPGANAPLPAPLTFQAAPTLAPTHEGAPLSPERKRLTADEFDIETRERLAQLDVQAAEEDYAAAVKDLSRVRASYEAGRLSAAELAPSENAYRHAALEVKRAKLKLDALKRQRTELEADAEVAVAQAGAERELAAARVRAAETARESARAQVQKAEADVQSAEVKVAYEQKKYDRIKNLVAAKAVDEKLLLEQEEGLEAAKAAVVSAQAAVNTAKAHIAESEPAIEEAQAALSVAESQLRTAQAHRDRLIHRAAADGQAPDEPAPAKTDNPRQ